MLMREPSFFSAAPKPKKIRAWNCQDQGEAEDDTNNTEGQAERRRDVRSWDVVCSLAALPWDLSATRTVWFGLIHFIASVWIGVSVTCSRTSPQTRRVWIWILALIPFSFFFFLHFDIISDLQKRCKNNTKNSYIPFTQISQTVRVFPRLHFLSLSS